MHKKWQTILFVFLPAAAAFGQTQVDLRTQSKSVDFSGATLTKPARVGSSVPTASCTIGEAYFNSSALPGQNLYLCSATNSWSQLTTGSTGSTPVTSTSSLTDLFVTRTNANTLSIGSNCSVSAPCNVRFGSRTVPVTIPATATVPTGANVAGTAYIYVSSAGQITVGDSMGVTCGSCSEVAGVTQFPSDSIPVFIWTATAGTWDLTGFDMRAFLSNKSMVAGQGIVTADVSGQTVVSADTSIIGFRVAAPATSSTACTTGTYAFDTAFYYQCVAANTWLRAAITTW